jgi:hypothetical protein
MNIPHLAAALQHLIEAEERAASEELSIERPSCPSPARFYVAYPQGWTPIEAMHIETCPYCQRSLAFIRSLAEGPPTPSIVLAAHFAWNTLRKSLEITVDEARHLVSADSPFGKGFQIVHAGATMGGTLGDEEEKPIAYAGTREGDELSIGVKGGHVTARFDGDAPPRLNLKAELGAQDASETRNFKWEKTRRGWQADLGEASTFSGLLTAEIEPDGPSLG